MSSSFSEQESPLDVLSRAATMVEKTVIQIRESQSPTTTSTSSSTNSTSSKGKHTKRS